MASAFCVACQMRQAWHGSRGQRLADRRCHQCNGPLVGSTARAFRRFEFELSVTHEAATLYRYAQNERAVEYWFAGDGWSRVDRRWRALASQAFKLWPELRP